MNFRTIKNYEGLYEVSDTGIVRSLDRYILCKNGSEQFFPGKVLQPYTDKLGYKFVSLSKHSCPVSYPIHRLVAQTFIPNPDNFPEVNHKDFNPGNNSVNNLEWCDRKYNVNYSRLAGRLKKSEKDILRLQEINCKPVYCFETDTVYTSRKQASQILGVSTDAILTSIEKQGRLSSRGVPIKYRFIDVSELSSKSEFADYSNLEFFQDGTLCRILNTDIIVHNYKELSQIIGLDIQSLWSNIPKYNGYIWECRLCITNIGYNNVESFEIQEDAKVFANIERQAFKKRFKKRKIVCCDNSNYYVSAVDCAKYLGMPHASIYEIIERFGGYSKKYNHTFRFCDINTLSISAIDNLIENYYQLHFQFSRLTR